MLTRDRRSRRRGRPGAIRLNQGSSPFGVSSVLRLNQPGGTFGAGRSAGGGPGAAKTLAQALSAPGPSIQGQVSEVGPPPVTPSILPPEEHAYRPPIPTFSPRPFDTPSILAALYPTFTPITYPPRGLRAF